MSYLTWLLVGAGAWFVMLGFVGVVVLLKGGWDPLGGWNPVARYFGRKREAEPAPRDEAA